MLAVVAYNQVRMANLSIVGSHTVNGVSKLHSKIITDELFNDYYIDSNNVVYHSNNLQPSL